MDKIEWSESVTYCTLDKRIHTISNAKQALVALFDRWPVRTGSLYFTAMDVCYQAGDGLMRPEAARSAFLAAAVEAGALVRKTI
ncbi:DUF982 domain-containing protein [Rhizobium binxianense]